VMQGVVSFRATQRAHAAGRVASATAILALLLTIPFFLGCSSFWAAEKRSQAVIWFEEYNEVYTGVALRTGHVLAGGVIDVRNLAGDVRCVGRSYARIVPPAVDDEHCDGLTGNVQLSCSDGRLLALDYQVDASCLTGYGSGKDQDGRALHAIFGGSAKHAQTIAREAEDYVKANPRLPAVAGGTSVGKAAATSTSTGTAFFVSWEGHLVTNHHVIANKQQVHVKLSDGGMFAAKVVAKDPENDLALLRIDLIREPLALTRQPELAKGEQVFALGYPLVSLQGQEQKATFGRVNALSGIQGDPRYAQVDVPIQPGNSGGPLLDKHGEVVGVVTSMLHQGTVMELAGVVPQNVNYALKSGLVQELLDSRIVETWTPAKGPHAEREFGQLIEQSQDSVVLVVAW
jgi:S1-C subfamily serine protease